MIHIQRRQRRQTITNEKCKVPDRSEKIMKNKGCTEDYRRRYIMRHKEGLRRTFLAHKLCCAYSETVCL